MEKDTSHVLVCELLGRVAVELAGLADSASSVQTALGKTMDQVADLCDVPIIEFQALDRMQQKLEDLNNLSLLISEVTLGLPNLEISKEELRQTLKLTSLAGRLEGIDTANFDAPSADEESGSLTLF